MKRVIVVGSGIAGLVAAIEASARQHGVTRLYLSAGTGILAGAVMGFLTVTLGANQHVSGLGLTIALVGLSELGNRLLLTGSELQKIEPFPQWNPLAGLGDIGTIFQQYGLTYAAFLLVAPATWWLIGKTPFGLSLRAVGENPHMVDAAGVSVLGLRYGALVLNGLLCGQIGRAHV